jgi:hypothetical protein
MSRGTESILLNQMLHIRLKCYRGKILSKEKFSAFHPLFWEHSVFGRVVSKNHAKSYYIIKCKKYKML